MSGPHHEISIRASIGAAWQRCLEWISGGGGSEFQYMDEQNIEQMARDAGVTSEELREMVRRGSGSADLLLERMAALDLRQKRGEESRAGGIPGSAARLHHV